MIKLSIEMMMIKTDSDSTIKNVARDLHKIIASVLLISLSIDDSINNNLSILCQFYRFLSILSTQNEVS